ncbi:MAG: phosphatase PAP2 family protein [Longimicrobiales bacterium]
MGVTRIERAQLSPGRTPRRWLLASLWGRMRARYRESWLALPESHRKRWLLTILTCALGLFGLMAGLVQIGKIAVAQHLLDWEAEFLRTLELRGPFGFSGAVWFQTFGTDITLAILIMFSASLSAWNRRPLSALSIPLAFIGVDLVVRFGWASWDRVRPDIIMQGLASPGFHSFPSGHTGKTLAVYGFLAFLWWRATQNVTERVFVLVLTAFIVVIVPLGRLRMGVHWPSDIIGGYIIGMVWLGCLIWATRLENRTTRAHAAPAGPA